MINALRYEPHGQHQRFEPQEQRSRKRAEKHLHLHLHLGSWTRLRPFSQPSVTRVTRIFAAFMAALSMVLTLNDQVSVARPADWNRNPRVRRKSVWWRLLALWLMASWSELSRGFHVLREARCSIRLLSNACMGLFGND